MLDSFYLYGTNRRSKYSAHGSEARTADLSTIDLLCPRVPAGHHAKRLDVVLHWYGFVLLALLALSARPYISSFAPLLLQTC